MKNLFIKYTTHHYIMVVIIFSPDYDIRISIEVIHNIDNYITLIDANTMTSTFLTKKFPTRMDFIEELTRLYKKKLEWLPLDLVIKILHQAATQTVYLKFRSAGETSYGGPYSAGYYEDMDEHDGNMTD